MTRWAVLLSCLLLCACAGAPAPPSGAALFRDNAFAPASVDVSARQLFAMSDEMTAYLRTAPHSPQAGSDPRRMLIDMLYRQRKLTIEYDSTTTRTAAEAFASQSGNCLSLVILTAAFAKAVGVPVFYQRVFVDETWSRSGDLYVASGHVNVALEWNPVSTRLRSTPQPALVVDFLPAEELRGERTRLISEATVVAMFMNNRAAEAMARGELDDAYWWAREAVKHEPTYLSAYNTLGVIYLRRRLASDADTVFSEVLRREPENTAAMGNLVLALRAESRGADADALAARLAKVEPYPPFYWFNAGVAAMREQDYLRAREMFTKEIRRDAYYHEFHFWLGLAEFGLGNVKAARKQIEMAMDDSTTPHEHDLYAAKLDRLRAYRTQ